MSHLRCFKLLPLITALSACTFGEGPELISPETDQSTTTTETTDDATSVVVVPVQLQEVNTQPAEAQIVVDQSDSLAVETNDSPVDADSLADNGSAINDNVEPDELLDVPTELDDTQPSTDQTNNLSREQDKIVRIPRTDRANAPMIDGNTVDYIGGTELLGGEWRFAAQFNGAGEPLGISNFMFGNADQALPGTYHHWAAMHDGEYLYLIVIVDDEGIHFQDTNEDRKLWKDDSVELFFDGNNSKLNEYDGVDDFHFTVNLQVTEGVPNNSSQPNAKVRQSDQSATLPSDLLFQNGIGKGPLPAGTGRVRKDLYEFRIKLSELNIQIEQPFGIEVQLNDDDDGDTRDAKWGWAHPEGEDASNDNTWQNPSFMGTAVLIR